MILPCIRYILNRFLTLKEIFGQMKKAIYTAVCVIVMAALPGSVLAGPVAVVESPVFEFDFVPEGVRVDHEFVIKNTGDAELEIENVLPP